MWKVIREDELYHHGIKGQKWGVRRFQNPDGTLTAEGRKRYGSKGSAIKSPVTSIIKNPNHIMTDYKNGKVSKTEDARDLANRILNGKVSIIKGNGVTVSEGRAKVGSKDVSLDLDLTDETNGRALLSNEKAIPYLKQVNKILDRIAKDDSQLKNAIADDNYDWVNTDTTVFGENPLTRKQFLDAFEPVSIDVVRYKSGPVMWVVYSDKHDALGYASADVNIDVNTGNIISTQLDW